MSAATEAQPGRAGPRLSASIKRAALPWLILAVVYALCVIASADFLTWHTIRLQLIQAAFIGLVAIGETLAILIGHIDLSIPWTITLTGMFATNLYAAHPHEWVAFGAAIGIGVAVGLVNMLGVYVLRVNSLIWTLSINLMLQGITLIYTNAAAPTTVVPPAAKFLALGMVGDIPMAAVLWAVCAIIVIGALRFTPFGRAVYALGSNELVALLSGVRLARTYAAVFITSGVMAALVGLLLSGYSSQAYLGMGDDYLLPPVAAVVIGGSRLAGGEGGYGGSIAGAMTVILLEAMLITLNVSQGEREIVFGAILLALAFLFLGRRRR
ncbi:ABC transporter permease [Acidisoma silvae]|uniref:ABC transporter permease n=1 Tax=Acidisoma silvae TaxID=2802396 RepID=A0A964E084_9PROT|nr:ABC transporter permease [Acidisoma silvae]MCB8876899.1 ABC transporter permease [Acidisoma silvae]